MSEQKPKIFLSYAHIDLGYAKKIYDDLKRYGLEIWFDKESLLKGQKWGDEIRKAIKESDFFIVLLSKSVISKKGFIYFELRFSFKILDEYRPSSKVFIIPVRLDKCKPSDGDKRLAELHWVDVFPESEYMNGINKILKIINPIEIFLRSKPGKLDNKEVENLIKKYDFFDERKNPGGKGLNHRYNFQRINDDFIVFDGATGLMWQQSGSMNRMNYEDAKNWITELNRKGYAGFNDWRLPTLEEAMSLMEPEKKNGRYIDAIFDSKQYWIWTTDQVKDESKEWVVDFGMGGCFYYYFYLVNYVRAIRSGQLFTK